MEFLIIGVLGLVVVASTAALEPRMRLAAPLVLVLLGIVVSLIPAVPAIEIDPELIIAGILPPLLYASAASMPAMEFRRDFGAIGGLSVVLVVVTSLLLGVFFMLVLPDLGFWWGVALGAIVSPTDAVATSIARRAGLSGRTATVLEGEGLLNDATALVLLRTAVAGSAATIGFGQIVGTFAYSVIVASVLGLIVGRVNVWVRSRIEDSTANTVLSIAVPFLASIPAELLGASGIVAAVVAGLITGQTSARHLPPSHRLSDNQVWSAIALVFEGAVFLILGLELRSILDGASDDGADLLLAVAAALGALLIVVVIRAGYVAPLLYLLHRRAQRGDRMRGHLEAFQGRLDDVQAPVGRIERMRTRTRRVLADIDYLAGAPMGVREGIVLVWAGTRGAVTVAAAQTLPADAPHRELMILVAFIVALVSLLAQGGTIGLVVRRAAPAQPDPEAVEAERAQLLDIMREAAAGAEGDADTTEGRITVLNAQRRALLAVRDDGTISSEELSHALAGLDAAQITVEMRRRAPEK